MKSLLVLMSALLGASAFAHDPQVEKTVNAFIGAWEGEMTAVTPFGPPETIQNKLVCHPIASGAGAECSSEAQASIGSLTQSCLVAFDSSTSSIHYMCVSNMGEVHDHKGAWSDEKTIQYEPYVGFVSGERVTEYVKTMFPDSKTMIHTSVMESADGSKMSFEFRAHKKE